MRRFLRNLEIILTGAGVAVVAIFFALFRDVAPWKAAELSALGVGVLHGIIFFAVRSAQRQARHKAVTTIRHTLDDLVRNKLQVVLFATEIRDEDWRPAAPTSGRRDPNQPKPNRIRGTNGYKDRLGRTPMCVDASE